MIFPPKKIVLELLLYVCSCDLFRIIGAFFRWKVFSRPPVLVPKLNCSPNRLKYAVHETPASPLLLLEFSVSPPRPSHEEEETAQNRRGRKRGETTKRAGREE